MTKTDMSATRDRHRAELLDRLRRFEWGVAREEAARAARAVLRGRTHDLLNFVQIVDLASRALAPYCTPLGDEIIVDLQRASDDAKVSVRELQALGYVDERAPVRTEVAPVARAAIADARGAVATLDAQVLVADTVAIAWTPEELELVLIAVALDGTRDTAIELLVRARAIDGRACVELVCGPLDEHGLGIQLAAALAARSGGDAAVAERRGGGHEVAIAIPVIA